MPEKNEVNFNISTLTIVKVVLVVLALAFVYMIRDVIGVVLISFIIASALTPFVDWLERKHKIPRVISIIVVYIALFGVISLVLILLIPAIINQVGDIANNFPEYYNRIQVEFGNLKDFTLTSSFFDNLQDNLQGLRADIGKATGGILSTITSVFGGIFAFVGVLVITFYLILEEQAMRRFLEEIVPPKYLQTVLSVLDTIQNKMGRWLRGQLVLSLVVFTLTFIGLSLMGVKNALVLALFAGIMEFIPYIGSTIGAIPAVFFGFTQSTYIGLAVIALYIVIQQLENNIIVPKVMQKAVGLNPIVVIVVMLIGAKVAGIVGVLLAVPAVLIFEAIFKAIYKIYDESEKIASKNAQKS